MTVFVGVAAAEESQPLNVLFIMADDLGWSDTTLYGTTSLFETPNIQRLADLGTTFTRAYTASPLCSPTRASIMTGQTPARNGHTAPEHHMGNDTIRMEASVRPSAPANQKSLQCFTVNRLDTSWPTLGKLLQAAGIRTGHFGKWHLGRTPYAPLDHGFEVDVPNWFGSGPAGGFIAPWNYPNFNPNFPGEHIEDRMAEEAVAWMRTVADEPFYLQYWQFSVHAPFDAKQDLIDYYRPKIDRDSPQRSPTYAAMVHSLDDAVGTMLDEIERLGIADRTVIIFYSDNGGNVYNFIEETDMDGNIYMTHPTSNAPLRGSKGSMWEGGVRVPLVVVWPGVTEPGSVSDVIIQSTDWYPTFLSLFGVDLPDDWPIDGVDLAPAFRGEPFDRGPMFNYFPHSPPSVPDQLPPSISVHKDEWKLIRLFYQGTLPGEHDYLLFNLEEDIGEQNNLAALYPAKVAELDALIEAHIQDADAVVPLPNPAYWERSFWSGAEGTHWNDAANWSVLPEAGTNLAFTGSINTDIWNDFNPGMEFGSMMFDAAAAPFTLSGNAITSGELFFGGNPAEPVTHTIALNMQQSTGRRVTTAANGSLLITGDLSGPGNFDILGSGTLTLTGSNTFDGVLQVMNGTLVVNTLGNTGAASAIGTGNRFRIGQGDDSAELILAGSPGPQVSNKYLFVGQNVAGRIGSATIRNNNIDPANTLTFTNASFTGVQASANQLRTLTLGGSNTGLNRIEGIIADNSAEGPIGVIKADAGTWVLSGDNTFTGGLQVDGGKLVFSGTQSHSGGITVRGGVLEFNVAGNLGTTTNPLMLDGGTLRDVSAAGVILGPNRTTTIETGGATIEVVGSAANLRINGPLQGSGDLVVSGAGMLTPSNLGEENSFSGSWTILGGATVAVSTASNGGNVRLGRGNGDIHFDGGTLQIGASVATEYPRNSQIGNGGATVVLGPAANQNPLVTWTGDMSGPGGLTISNNGGTTGEFTLAGTNTYAGNTTVNAGSTLRLAASGSLRLVIGESGFNSRLTGTGAVELNGTLVFDLDAAATEAGSSWQVIAPALLPEVQFGEDFAVEDFVFGADSIWYAQNGEFAFDPSTGQLTRLELTYASSFQTWIDGFDLAPEQRGLLASPAGDGKSNLEKYAFGLNPSEFWPYSMLHPNWSELAGSSYFTVEAVVRTDDPALQVFAETSLNLTDWTQADEVLGDIDQSDVPSGFERKRWQSTEPMDVLLRAFMQLRITYGE